MSARNRTRRTARRQTRNAPAGGEAAELLARAEQARAAGDLNRAGRFLRKYLARRPDAADVWHGLGATLYEAGSPDAAIEALERAAALAPQDANILGDLAGLYVQRERFHDAERASRAALAVTPDAAGARYNLAIALGGQHRNAESIATLARLVADFPEFAEAHFNLGVAQHAEGLMASAIASFEKARALTPGGGPATLELARCFRELKSHDRAIAYYRDYCARHRDLQALMEHADCLHETGATDEAIALLEAALADSPDDDSLWFTLGRIQQNAGRLEAAERAFRRSFELNPKSARAVVTLSRVRRFTDADDPVIGWLTDQLARARPGDSMTPALHFALGKVYDDLSRYDEAFTQYERGNALRRRTGAYDRDETERAYARVVDVLPAAEIQRLQSLGNSSEVPVVIVGMPRSGTTLVEQIIDRHPAMTGAGELQFFPSLAQRLPRLMGTKTAFPECIREIDVSAAERITASYLELLRRHSPDALRIADKLPGNYLYLGLIKGVFPRARIVCCQRDPVDVALSIYFQYFANGHEYSWDLDDIAHMYEQYAGVMEHWRTVLPGDIIDVVYEDFVGDLETAARRLVDALGLPWSDHCLDFHRSRRDVKTASNWQVRQPIYDTSLARWRHYESHLGTLMSRLRRAGGIARATAGAQGSGNAG